jgi:raffinose/stachyose/melibiose transport system permease protein
MIKLKRLSGTHGPAYLNHTFLILMTIFAIAPIVILTMNSVKTRQEIGTNSMGLPREIHLENYGNAWEEGNFATTVANSLIYVGSTVFLVLTFGGFAAYSLARLNPPGSNGFMLYMLVATTIPFWLYVIPLFFLWRSIGLLNSRIGLIIIYTAFNAPFAIFLLRSFLLAVPADLEDAARIDGAGELQVFFQVVMPIAWTGFLTVGLVVALGVWGEYQVALIFMHDPNLFPVTTSYSAFTQRFGRDWALTSSAAIMMIAPVIILFLGLQRQFIEGLTQGSVK